MSDRARRKERQRLKRKQKQLAQRRAKSISPYQRIGQSGETEACYINANWQDCGFASIHVIRRNPAGGHAMAGFLIDLWCSGLKDAWGGLDLLMEDIDRNLHRARDTFDLVRIDADQARKFIAAGIRFARQNGFRLPDHFDRWTKMLGGVGDVSTADLTGFTKEGKLLWVGAIDELRRRLIGSTVDDFLARPDVAYIAEIETSDINDIDEDSEEFEALVEQWREMLTVIVDRFADEIHAALLSRGQDVPSPLVDATRFLFAGEIVRDAKERGEPLEDSSPSTRAHLYAAESILVDLLGDAQAIPDPLVAAIRQIVEVYSEVSTRAMEQAAEIRSQIVTNVPTNR